MSKLHYVLCITFSGLALSMVLSPSPPSPNWIGVVLALLAVAWRPK